MKANNLFTILFLFIALSISSVLALEDVPPVEPAWPPMGKMYYADLKDVSLAKSLEAELKANKAEVIFLENGEEKSVTLFITMPVNDSEAAMEVLKKFPEKSLHSLSDTDFLDSMGSLDSEGKSHSAAEDASHGSKGKTDESSFWNDGDDDDHAEL